MGLRWVGLPSWVVSCSDRVLRARPASSYNDFIYFDVDDAFAAQGERRFRIAVTYQNAGTATWHLDYSTETNPLVSTPTVTNTGNASEVKTVIFSLSDVSFRNAYAGGTMDFRISNGEGTQDVTIRSVRVMRGGQ
jgi:hypothetical protein